MSVAASTPEAWATLSLKALPHQPLVALLRTFGGPAAVLAATRAQLLAIVPEAIAARALEPVDLESLAATRRWLAEPAHEIVAWDDADYPRTLLDLGYAPPALFFVGRRELLNRPALAIVGSRNATAQGAINARAFASALSNAGLTIVSGLAIGIDAAAHEGALDCPGSTLAVVGTGLDRVGQLQQGLLAFGGRGLPPGVERRVGRPVGGVHVGGRRDRSLGDDLTGRRVDDVTGGIGAG